MDWGTAGSVLRKPRVVDWGQSTFSTMQMQIFGKKNNWNERAVGGE